MGYYQNVVNWDLFAKVQLNRYFLDNFEELALALLVATSVYFILFSAVEQQGLYYHMGDYNPHIFLSHLSKSDDNHSCNNHGNLAFIVVDIVVDFDIVNKCYKSVQPEEEAFIYFLHFLNYLDNSHFVVLFLQHFCLSTYLILLGYCTYFIVGFPDGLLSFIFKLLFPFFFVSTAIYYGNLVDFVQLLSYCQSAEVIECWAIEGSSQLHNFFFAELILIIMLIFSSSNLIKIEGWGFVKDQIDLVFVLSPAQLAYDNPQYISFFFVLARIGKVFKPMLIVFRYLSFFEVIAEPSSYSQQPYQSKYQQKIPQYLYYSNYESMIFASLISIKVTFNLLLSGSYHSQFSSDMNSHNVSQPKVQNITHLAEFTHCIRDFFDFSEPWVAYSQFLCKDQLGSRTRSYNYSFYISPKSTKKKQKIKSAQTRISQQYQISELGSKILNPLAGLPTILIY